MTTAPTDTERSAAWDQLTDPEKTLVGQYRTSELAGLPFPDLPDDPERRRLCHVVLQVVCHRCGDPLDRDPRAPGAGPRRWLCRICRGRDAAANHTSEGNWLIT